ncbi:hypothetical protein SVAN01_11952 [Stagonosporopsis vannaccii]|nr:hypothetical protein SVAN01_11952 [Stagonosporopsis vannaccii]
MSTTTSDHKPFRFLDLPTELRCYVYENIEFPTTRHVLHRTQALLNERDWPHPPELQAHDSCVTLIRPRTEFAINILTTCHLIHQEACGILRHKIQQYRHQSVRYCVDFSAAWALVGLSSALRSCLGVRDGDINKGENSAVQTFLRRCALSLSQTRSTPNDTQRDSRHIPTVQMTITHKSDVTYSREVAETMMWLSELQNYIPARLVVVYESPLPKTQIVGSAEAKDSRKLEELLLHLVPRECEAGLFRGVFLRPLTKDAFERHMVRLESY